MAVFLFRPQYVNPLTHWGRVTHICVGNLTIIGPDNGLSPGRRQAIIWTNAGILLIWPWGTNFSEILIGIQAFSFTKMHLKMSSAKWGPFCLGLNVLSASPVYVRDLTSVTNVPADVLAPNKIKYMFLNDNVWISIKISLNCVHNGSINNIPPLVQIVAWRRPGYKPLPESMMVYWRIYAPLGLNEFTDPKFMWVKSHHNPCFPRAWAVVM